MGLRFRKSITILPGVKLNLGKTGVSVSAGVRGFRKTFHSSGKVTTSVGIPGTGISYVDTKTRKKKTDNKTTKTTQTKSRTKKQTKTVEPVETVAPVQTTYAPTQTT